MDKQKLAVVVVVLVLVVVVGGVLLMNNRQLETANISDNSNNLITDNSNESLSFKDGTYRADGEYTNPSGKETVGVEVALKDNIITDVTVTNEADDPTSEGFQDQFISGFKSQVVGKKITEVNLTKVSGSSLTPRGFNDALTKIETQARM